MDWLFQGYTWWKWTHYSNPNPEWLVHLPMTKAAVRAMDTITDFMTSPLSPSEIQELNCNPQQFITAGASKRGWITWLTGLEFINQNCIHQIISEFLFLLRYC